MTKRLVEIGAEQIGIADTIGVGIPLKVQRALQAALEYVEILCYGGYFHDTYGQALSNTLAALQMGVSEFDTSVAGLGGCPYAKGATGEHPSKMWCICCMVWVSVRVSTWINWSWQASISAFLKRPNGSNVARALINKRH